MESYKSLKEKCERCSAPIGHLVTESAKSKCPKCGKVYKATKEPDDAPMTRISNEMKEA